MPNRFATDTNFLEEAVNALNHKDKEATMAYGVLACAQAATRLAACYEKIVAQNERGEQHAIEHLELIKQNTVTKEDAIKALESIHQKEDLLGQMIEETTNFDSWQETKAEYPVPPHIKEAMKRAGYAAGEEEF